MLFNDLMIALSNEPIEFSVTHGIAFGHRMIIQDLDYFRVVELEDNKIAVEDRDGFYCQCFTLKDALKAIDETLK